MPDADGSLPATPSFDADNYPDCAFYEVFLRCDTHTLSVLPELNEREISLGIAGDEKRSWHSVYKQSAWIYVGGLKYEMSEGGLITVFSQFGEILNGNLIRDKKTGKSKGFAFICYQNQRRTNLAVDNFNGYELLKRIIRVDHVEEYKVPKYAEDAYEETKRLWEKGCGSEPIFEAAPSAEEIKKQKKRIKKEAKKTFALSSEADLYGENEHFDFGKKIEAKVERWNILPDFERSNPEDWRFLEQWKIIREQDKAAKAARGEPPRHEARTRVTFPTASGKRLVQIVQRVGRGRLEERAAANQDSGRCGSISPLLLHASSARQQIKTTDDAEKGMSGDHSYHRSPLLEPNATSTTARGQLFVTPSKEVQSNVFGPPIGQFPGRALFTPSPGSLPLSPLTLSTPPSTPLTPETGVLHALQGLSRAILALPKPPSGQERRYPVQTCQRTRYNLVEEALRLEDLGLTLPDVIRILAYVKGMNPFSVRKALKRGMPSASPDGLIHCSAATVPRDESSRSMVEAGRFSAETARKLKQFIHGEFFSKGLLPSKQDLINVKDVWIGESDKGKTVNKRVMAGLLRRNDFSFKTIETLAHVFASANLANLRATFLRRMKQHRDINAIFGYIDETWFHVNMRATHGWVDTWAEKHPLLSIAEGYTPGPILPNSRGRRFISVGMITEFGMANCETWSTNREDDGSDFHKEMDAKLFETWVKGALQTLKDLGDQSGRTPVLVMDNASYHSRYLEKKPPKSTTKALMRKWLDDHGLPYSTELKKVDLHNKCIAPLDNKVYNKLAVETLAEEYGVVVIRLPPYHCQYNPIELVWGWIKDALRKQLSNADKGPQLKANVTTLMASISPLIAAKYIAHTAAIEEARQFVSLDYLLLQRDISEGALDPSTHLHLVPAAPARNDDFVAAEEQLQKNLAKSRERAPSTSLSLISDFSDCSEEFPLGDPWNPDV